MNQTGGNGCCIGARLADTIKVSIRGGLVELTEELLDRLGDEFLQYRVRDLLGITFVQFLRNPEFYIRRTCDLLCDALEIKPRSSYLGWDLAPERVLDARWLHA
ncbi:MAG: hypothetical protein AAGU11_03025 [Syntrophobacteraceae bacterium]